MSTLVLVLLSLSSSLSSILRYRPSIDGSSFTCSEKDDVPVDTEEIFEGHCESIQGNKYAENSETSSCCECLIYTCMYYETVHDKKLYFWNTTVSESCCVSCNKTVYKHDSVISSSELEDECQTNKQSICRIL